MREKRYITIKDGENDLLFSVEQMPALKLEKWIYRAVILLAKANGAEIAGESMKDARAAVAKLKSGDADGSGVAWIVNTIGGLDFDKAEPLMDEMMGCVKLLPDANNRAVEMPMSATTIEGHISSPLTLMKVRLEALKANFSFFSIAGKPETPAEPTVTFRRKAKTSRL